MARVVPAGDRSATTRPTSSSIPTGASMSRFASPQKRGRPRRQPTHRCTTNSGPVPEKAQISPHRGRDAAITSTWEPVTIRGPMDEPETLTHNGPPATRRRSKRASATGSVVDIAGLSLSLRATGNAHQQVLDTLFGSLAPSPRSPVAELVFGRSAVAMPRRPADEEYP